MWYNDGMDNRDYLNQISAKPVAQKKKGAGGLLGSKLTLIIIGAVVLFIAFAIIGSVLGSNKDKLKDNAVLLQLHLDSTAEIISKYQPSVKSSALRSDSASLSGIITNTNSKLTNYLVEKYDYKKSAANKDLIEQVKTEQDALDADLFEAKINGVLDRMYAHKMTYEITILKNEESKLYGDTKDEALKEILSESLSSLENLYTKFNDFSEG